ncbi:MAG: SIS domain-containing protein [Oscillospiraceae bacterium]|nr:SIS domain-containing protein [Oscillospiraceae bacterium]
MENKTYHEIHGQYSALKMTLERCDEKYGEFEAFFRETDADNIVVIGCGSSYQLSCAVASNAHLFSGLPSMSIAGGDLMIHIDNYDDVFSKKTLLITLSRSGSTHEILYAVKKIREKYPLVKILSFVCAENSNIAAISDKTLEMPWAFDESVCQTRSVTNIFAGALYILAKVFGRILIAENIAFLALNGDAFLEQIEPQIKQLAGVPWENAMVLCDGESFGVAEEAALAFNEIAYTPSGCKHVLDVRHGPIVLIGEHSLVVANLTRDGFDYEKPLINDLLNKKSTVVVISDEELPALPGVCAQFTFGKKLHSSVSAMLLLPAAQLLSYYKALALGVNPDSPEGLDAWIALK